MKKAVFFDLGNTLVSYYTKKEFPTVLKQSIIAVYNYLRLEGLIPKKFTISWQKVQKENYESSDHRVRPLEDRLRQIFGLDLTSIDDATMLEACSAFMNPIFARARLHQDVLPTLKELKRRRFKLSIVSNTPWGSPSQIWRAHLEMVGISQHFEGIIFCRDVGWRKPAKQIFEYALREMGVSARQSIFVGDDFRWDVQGPRTVGMDCLLIVRNVMENLTIPSGVRVINSLPELLSILQLVTKNEMHPLNEKVRD